MSGTRARTMSKVHYSHLNRQRDRLREVSHLPKVKQLICDRTGTRTKTSQSPVTLSLTLPLTPLLPVGGLNVLRPQSQLSLLLPPSLKARVVFKPALG